MRRFHLHAAFQHPKAKLLGTVLKYAKCIRPMPALCFYWLIAHAPCGRSAVALTSLWLWATSQHCDPYYELASVLVTCSVGSGCRPLWCLKFTVLLTLLLPSLGNGQDERASRSPFAYSQRSSATCSPPSSPPRYPSQTRLLERLRSRTRPSTNGRRYQ